MAVSAVTSQDWTRIQSKKISLLKERTPHSGIRDSACLGARAAVTASRVILMDGRGEGSNVDHVHDFDTHTMT